MKVTRSFLVASVLRTPSFMSPSEAQLSDVVAIRGTIKKPTLPASSKDQDRLLVHEHHVLCLVHLGS